jgi:hypothetical protein
MDLLQSFKIVSCSQTMYCGVDIYIYIYMQNESVWMLDHHPTIIFDILELDGRFRIIQVWFVLW